MAVREPALTAPLRSPGSTAKLIFLCGKMAAGKSTLARALAEREGAILLVQDQLLGSLYPGEIVDIPAFTLRSSQLQAALEPHICALLANGVTVVLDFPANTLKQRAWVRGMFERAKVAHELHFVDVPDALCKAQLRERSSALPVGSPWTTDAEFEAIPRIFSRPPPMRGSTLSVTSAPRSRTCTSRSLVAPAS